MAQPNILYLHSHDTGRYIQPYGFAIPTPKLQTLAEQGILFRQAFCCAPTCSASRAALLTGQSPHANGMFGLAHRGFRLFDYRHHILHTLREAGYYAALSGVSHVANHADGPVWKTIGYDRCLCEAATPVGEIENAAADFLNNPPDQPFFLSVGFSDTHREFLPLEQAVDDPRYVRPPLPLPDTPETRRDMVRYMASCRLLDARMGAVLDALDASGLADNTLVICTTDHGVAFPRMKASLTDSGLGVMLIMRGPGGFDGGRVCDELVSHLDIFPTVCDVAGIEPPARLEGRSLLPWVAGESESIREELYGENTFHASYEPMRSVRTKRYKYIRRYGDRRRTVLCNCDNGESKDLWMACGWADREHPDEALYDVIFDPNEADNLAADPAHAEVLADMRARLDAWMRRTGDPLPSGELPLCDDAQMTDPDCPNPGECIYLVKDPSVKIERR